MDESVPQAEDVLPANDSGEQTPTIVANTISEPDNIKRDIYEDIRFWYDDKYQICMSYSGCACADSICPMSTACVEGKCIDPLTGNEVNSGGFISTVQCADEAICGCPSSCGKNAWCVAGRCYSKLFSVIYQDIRLLYNPFGMLYRAIKGDLDDRVYEQYESDE